MDKNLGRNIIHNAASQQPNVHHINFHSILKVYHHQFCGGSATSKPQRVRWNLSKEKFHMGLIHVQIKRLLVQYLTMCFNTFNMFSVSFILIFKGIQTPEFPQVWIRSWCICLSMIYLFHLIKYPQGSSWYDK